MRRPQRRRKLKEKEKEKGKEEEDEKQEETETMKDVLGGDQALTPKPHYVVRFGREEGSVYEPLKRVVRFGRRREVRQNLAANGHDP